MVIAVLFRGFSFLKISTDQTYFPLVSLDKPLPASGGVQSQLTTTKLEAIEYNFTIPASDLFTRSPGDWHLDQAVVTGVGFFGGIFDLRLLLVDFLGYLNVEMTQPSQKKKKKHASLFWVLSRGSVEMAWRSVLIGVVFFSCQSCPGVGWGEMEVVGVSNMWYQVVSGAIRELKTPKYR